MIILGLFFSHVIAVGFGWYLCRKHGADVKATVDEVL